MAFFPVVPPALKHRDLKITVVSQYEVFSFEAWLAGSKRQVQREYLELLRDGRWPRYRVVTPAEGVDSIIEFDLAEDFDSGHLDAPTAAIEKKSIRFIHEIERFLFQHEPGSRD